MQHIRYFLVLVLMSLLHLAKTYEIFKTAKRHMDTYKRLDFLQFVKCGQGPNNMISTLQTMRKVGWAEE